eukprot:TRINITY_DN66527_c0_g2_i3.p1 TRINITY_DN66527_c0_g2~~TRINITY_DN66527_c0_g2_i3.p1  ORF type:complete len:553 (+),score=105.52 TRINITY_DN66527_c0_g2_i3:44-1660(+)
MAWLEKTPPSYMLPNGRISECSPGGFTPGAASERERLRNVRQRYLQSLQNYGVRIRGYVPNLLPLLRWQYPQADLVNPMPSPGLESPLHTAMPSPASSRDYPSGHSQLYAPMLDKIRERSSSVEEKTDLREMRHRSLFSFNPGSVRSSIINVVSATLGGGALALPKAFYYSGIGYGVLLMFFLAALSVVSIKLIVQVMEMTHKKTYEEISNLAFGPWFSLALEMNILLFCFGTAVAYMISVGQIFGQVAHRLAVGGMWETSTALRPEVLLVVVTVVLLLPLSTLDKLNELRFASLVGVSCIMYLVLVVFFIFLRDGVDPSLPDASEAMSPADGYLGVFRMLSLSIFAFCCQPNVPSIYVELEFRSLRRMDKVSLRSMSLCFAAYLLIGVSGFLLFGADTAGSILDNLQPLLCKNDLIVMSAFACMAFAMSMAFPLNIFPIRYAVETLLFYRMPSWNTSGTRFVITASTVALALGAAVSIPEINLVFELVGATTGSFVCFLAPGLLYCKLMSGPWWSMRFAPAYILVAAGLCLLVLGTP